MSIQAVAWAIEQSEVPPRPALVLIALANHANHIDGRAYLFIETIAKEARCSRRAVFGYIAALERNGYVEIRRTRKKSGRQGCNNYWLVFDRLPLPWAHLPDHHTEPEPPIAPEDAEIAEEQDLEENSPSDPSAIIQSAQNAPGSCLVENRAPVVNNPPPECKASAPGQSATVCTRQESSDSEPLDSITLSPVEGRAPLRTNGPPLGYRPQARLEQAAGLQTSDEGRKPKPEFAFEGSRAYLAWKAHKEQTLGRSWNLLTTAIIEGKQRRGWWFPTLFPPKSTGPPPSLMTAADHEELTRGL